MRSVVGGNKKYVKKIAVLIASIAVIVAAFAISQIRTQPVTQAATSLGFSEFATHPYASNTGYDETSVNYYTGEKLCTWASFCPTGQNLKDIEFTEDGKLIAGYGDWNSNVDSFGVPAGRIGVVPLDVSTKQWGSIFYAGSEALDLVRKINGKLYLPTTDPSDKTASTMPGNNKSGYVTNDTPDGSWKFVDNGRGMTHTFDVGISGNGDIFTVGSFQSKAYAMRSTNSGATWTESKTEQSGPGEDSTFARYYSISRVGDDLYTKAQHVTPQTTVQKFNGTTWQQETSVYPQCIGYFSPGKVDTFKGNAVCGQNDRVYVFDGTSERSVQFGGRFASDIYVTDEYLYVLSPDGIYRSATAQTGDWQKLAIEGQMPNAIHSMAVYGDYVYLGGSEGKIYRSNTTIQASPDIANEECFTVTDGVVRGYEVSCDTDVVVPAEVDGVPVTAISASAFSGRGVTSVALPDGLKRIEDNAFANNQIESVIIPNTVEAIGNQAFANNQIQSLELSNILVSLGSYAFSGNKLSNIIIPASVQSVGGWAFADNELTSVTIPGNPTVGGSAFRHNGTPRENVPAGLSTVDKAQFYHQNASFVAVYTTNPATLTAYNANTRGWSGNKQYLASSTTNQYVAGATLLNPSQLSVEFVDAEGNELTPSQTKTGQRANGVPLTHRKLASAINATNPLALTVDRTVFYVIGQQASAPAPAISGFTQPAQRSVALSVDSSQNVLRYVYAAAGQPGGGDDGGVTTPQNPSAPGSQPGTGSGQPSQQGVGVPNTGLSSETKGTLIVFAAIATFGLGITIYASYRSGRQERT